MEPAGRTCALAAAWPSPMDRRMVAALQSQPGIDDWTLRLQRSRGVQIYLAGRAIESVREVSREAYEVELFNDHPVPAADGDGSSTARGSAIIPLARGDLARLDTILGDAVTMASLVHNPPWTLPGPADLPEVPLADARLASSAAAVAAGLEAADQIRELADHERGSGVRLSGAELFLTHYEEELRNSHGIEAGTSSTRILMEITLLARGADDETEYFRQAEGRRLDDLNLAATIRDGAALARDKLRATMPATRLGPVVIEGEALHQLMSGQWSGALGTYMYQADARTAYERISRFEIGASVYGEQPLAGEPLTLRANARRPFGTSSYRFDSDGLPAQDLLVIEDGVLRARPATQRYAQYLGVPATGRPGAAQIPAGRTATAGLLDGDQPLLHVLDFSASNVEAVSGDFGMEIRVGYEAGPDGARPVTGGSVTGNLFEAMADARFSSETAEYANYAGPSAIRFESLQVGGED
jgi:predicted Zn-dependent protease